MPSKYDTNPLDPDFPEKARAEAEAMAATETLPQGDAKTRQFPDLAQSEDQTRRFAGTGAAYVPPFNGNYVPATGYAPYVAPMDPRKRKVEKVGIPENVMLAVPYLPWFLGAIAGLVSLLLVPRSETKVRFHAAQGLAAHIGIFIVSSILSVMGNFTGVARAGNIIFALATTAMFLVFTYKAWKGRPIHIAAIEDLTNWLEEKIYVKPKQ